MRRRIGLVVVAVTLLATPAVQAEPKIELNPFAGVRFGGSIAGGTYETLTEELDFAEGDQYGVNLDIPFAMMGVGGSGGENLFLEFMFNTSGANIQFEPLNIDDVPDVILERFEEDDGKIIIAKPRVMYLHGGVLSQFRNEGVIPYINVGIGATIFDASEEEFEAIWKFSSRLGAGAKYMFNEKVGTRFQFTTYFTSMPSGEYWCDPFGCWEYEEWHSFFQAEASGGLVFAF
jgi:opacity protein-like surface antigen